MIDAARPHRAGRRAGAARAMSPVMAAALVLGVCLVVATATVAVSFRLTPSAAVVPAVAPADAPEAYPRCLEALALGPPGPAAAGVSRVIHQSWKTAEVPRWAQPIAESWTRVYAGDGRWRRVLHTDEDNYNVVRCVFPWAVPAYRRAKAIVRADLARAAYMYAWGGVYADLDVEAVKPLDELLERIDAEGDVVVLGRVDPPSKDHRGAIPNAIMASTRPGHPFWEHCMRDWTSNINRRSRTKYPEVHAGPIGLRRCLSSWVAAKGVDAGEALKTERPVAGVRLLDPKYLYPRSWKRNPIRECMGEALDPKACKEKTDLSEAYTIAYWRHSWSNS
eukprot:m51a1_g5774 hypothetical protein (335) ;mRNA; f:1250770-1251774